MKARTTGFQKIADNGSIVDGSKVAAANDTAFVDQQRAKLFSQSSQDAGRMPVEVFMSGKMVKYITPAALQQRIRNGQVSPEQKEKIEKNIRTYINEPTPEASRAKTIWQAWSNGNNTEGNQFNFDDNGSSGY